MEFKIKKQKFISLKEAAKISGYAPDYIGYLIRKGEISGKKIYSGVSWVTTEEEIKEYVSKKSDKKTRIIKYDQAIPIKVRIIRK
jgi:hypothetical protein